MASNKINPLNLFLSNLAVLNVKIHNLHWNVIGREFKEIHLATEKLYEMLQLQFDEVAEHLKMQKEFPFSSMADYIENTTIEELESTSYSVDEAVRIIYDDMQILAKQAREIRDKADEKDNFLVVNLLEDYLCKYSKFLWMLGATLGEDNENFAE